MASKYGRSVAEGRPDLVSEWSDKNTVTPDTVKPGSTRKVWWVCAKGHEWEAPVDNRVYNNTGCPFCAVRAGKRLLPGLNDLATTHPEVAAEWHPARNGDKTPSDTLPGVKKKAWWLCSACGREWEALLNMRTSRGTGCPSCRGRKRGLKNSGTIHWARLYQEWHPDNSLSLDDHSVNSQVKAKWVCENGHEWRASIGDRNLKQTGCKQCGSGGTSTAERDIRDFLERKGIEVRPHHRQIDPRYEYDITAPDRKLAVEFNGVYWHQEHFKGQRYHYDKTKAARNQGWSTVHIWEDDWRDRREVVERMLARRFGVSEEPRYHARKLEIVNVSAKESREFLEANHIQGASQGSVRLGLSTGEEIVALIVLRSRGSGSWELTRFASSGVVRGGFSKLLKAGIAQTEATRIVTFSDNCVSDGGLYETHGFERDGEIPPDYMYVVKGSRVHKFNYRKDRFKRDRDLKYVEGATERELADLNKIPRVWDAGKVRWVKNVTW